MIRVRTPRGVLLQILKAVPVCEQRYEINGVTKRDVEVADSMDCKPTGIIWLYEPQSTGIETHYAERTLVGNLKPEKVEEIMEKLLSDGYYDFSKLQYQKNAVMFVETVFDEGKTEPYASDYVNEIVEISVGELVGFGTRRQSIWDNGDIFANARGGGEEL